MKPRTKVERFARHKPVHDFIAACEKMDQAQREKAVTEMESFCNGYRDGKEKFWQWLLGLDVEQVIGEFSSTTLAETMTDLDVLPHRGKTGSKAPAPKGWS